MKRNKERGSITLYVLLAMLFFVLFGMGILIAVSNKQVTQKRNSDEIAKEYNSQNVEEVYQQVYHQDARNQDTSWQEYVRDGLVLQYDGIQNTKSGHSSKTTVWEDLSAAGNNGTLQNIQNTQTSGWKENCLTFDGVNDVVSTELKDSLKSQNYTAEILVNRKAITNSERSIVLVSWEGITIEMYNNHYIKFGTNRNNSYLLTQKTVQEGIPYKITCVYAGGVQKIYIDGILSSTKTISGTAPFSDTVLTIGSWKGTDPLQGDVYAVRMYSRELTANEIMKNQEIDQRRFQYK